MKRIVLFVSVLALVFASAAFAEKPTANLSIIKSGITVDGSTADWKALGIEPLIIDKASQVAVGTPYWLGKEKQSAKVYVAFAEDKIFICAEVKAPRKAMNKYTLGDIYKGNGIELFIGFNNAEPARQMYTETDYQIGISAGQYSAASKEWKVKPEAFVYNLQQPAKDAVIKVKNTETGYILEASIPASALDGFYVADGLELGFDIGIDDVGDSGMLRKVQMTWSGDKNGWENPKGWGKAVLKEKK